MQGCQAWLWCFIIVVASALPYHEKASQNAQSDDSMLAMQHAMQLLMTGGEKGFDAHFFEELRACMAKFDPELPRAQDKAWQGIIDYWDSNGTPSDEWGKFPSFYHEHNVTASTMHGMTIYEPCDYASNLAYYHDVLEICFRQFSGRGFSMSNGYVNAMGKGFSALAWGSAFWHGSNTRLGRQQDRKTLAVLAYAFHQASLSNLDYKSSVIHDLSATPRAKTAVQIIDDFQTMYLTRPVNEWYNITESFDIPDYMLIYSGIYCTILTLSFDAVIVDSLVPMLADAFKLPKDLRRFVLDDYIPEIRRATSSIHLPPADHAKLLGNTLGTTMKLIYAFLWQERVLTKSKLFLDPIVNYIGWELLPRVNLIANQFSSFQYFDPDFQNGTNLYPGTSWCSPLIPHAKWHLQSAIGLLDLAYLTDEICAILAK